MSKFHYDQALSLYQGGEYTAARDAFEEYTQNFPANSEGWLSLGNCHFMLGDLMPAERAFTKAIEVNPVEAKAYLNLGNLYFKQQLFRKAVHSWKTFTAIKPGNAKAWLNMGLAYEQMADIDNAWEAYAKYMNLDQSSPESLKLRIRFESAKKSFDSYVKAAENDMQADRNEAALKKFEEVLPQYPGTAKVYKLYASLLYQKERFEEARDYYLKAYQRTPDDPGLLINLGVLFEKTGRPLDAMWAYHQARQFKSKQRNQVEKRFQAVFSVHQGNADKFLRQARELMQNGDLDGAEEQALRLKDLLEVIPGDPGAIDTILKNIHDRRDPFLQAGHVFFSLAENAKQDGKFDQAIKFFNKYLEVQPKGPNAQIVRSQITEMQQVMGAAISAVLSDSEG